MGVILSRGRKSDEIIEAPAPPSEDSDEPKAMTPEETHVEALPPVDEDGPLAGIMAPRPNTYTVVMSRLAGQKFLGLRLEARQRAMMAAATKEAVANADHPPWEPVRD